MMNTFFSLFFRSPLAAALVLASISLEAHPVRLSGHVPEKVLSQAAFVGNVDPSTEISLTFTLPLRNQKKLEKLVQKIYDPTNLKHYGNYLTPEEFNEQFAPTNEDYEQIKAYAQSLGLIVVNTHSNRILLNVSGTSESLEKAFNLHLHHYQKSNGKIFHAPSDDPEVPSEIASLIHGIVGLDNHAVRHTYGRQKQIDSVIAVSEGHPSGPGGGYSPSDLLTAYNLQQIGMNGSNQIIALFELAGYQESDIQAYTSHFGLPSANLTNVLVDGGSSSGIDPEVTLDIELALALAPASRIYVYEGPNSDQGVLDTYNRIATDNLAKQVSTSWGLGENLSSSQYLQAENAIFLQMATHGQTIYAAAGDSGAYDDYPNNHSLVVDDPASQPYVIGVGGTHLTVNTANGAYSAESVWNDGLGNGAGGGGISGFWPIPTWQQNVNSAASKTHRNVPDVALNADTESGYSIYYDGQWVIYGGTSCAAPLWAAFTALVNQERSTQALPSLGFANPLFYSIGLGSSYTQNFHDIASGSNLYYTAHPGYDNASGWGSFNGANLFTSLTTVQPAQRSFPAFQITMTHDGVFHKRKTGVYTIALANQGNGATSGTVNIAIALPKGLACQSLQGSGWTCNQKALTCTQTNALQAGSSYPPITLTVNVLFNAPHTVTPTVTVSGGGVASPLSASDPTQIY